MCILTGNAEVIIFSNNGIYNETVTDANGRFSFGFHAPDGVRFFVQAKNQKGSEWVDVTVNPPLFPEIRYAPVSRSLLPAASKQDYSPVDFIQKASQCAEYDEDLRVVNLEEIVVSANRIEKRDEERLKFPFNRLSDVTIYSEEIEKRKYVSVSQALQGIPGVQVFTKYGNIEFIYMRGDGSFDKRKIPLILINGVTFGIFGLNNDVNLNDIESIDIFKGGSASVFGLRGGHGVISITLKSARSQTIANVLKQNSVSVTPLD